MSYKSDKNKSGEVGKGSKRRKTLIPQKDFDKKWSKINWNNKKN